METKHNFQQQPIRRERSQTMIFDPKLTLETDELNPDFKEAAKKMIKPTTTSKSRIQDLPDAEQSSADI
jgi:hypothetical protein